MEKLSKIGKKFKLDGASQYGIARSGERIEIKPHSTVTKIRDNFADIMKFRSMYIIDESGIEVDIGDSLIGRYFAEVLE